MVLLRLLLLIAGIVCLPLSFAVAQTSDTQTSTEPAKDEEKKAEEKKEEEEEEIQTQEQKLQEEVTVTGTGVEGRVATDTPSPVDIIDSDMLQKWDPNKAFPFPQLGFIYGWETLPFGMNGGSFYGRVTYKF